MKSRIGAVVKRTAGSWYGMVHCNIFSLTANGSLAKRFLLGAVPVYDHAMVACMRFGMRRMTEVSCAAAQLAMCCFCLRDPSRAACNCCVWAKRGGRMELVIRNTCLPDGGTEIDIAIDAGRSAAVVHACAQRESAGVKP